MRFLTSQQIRSFEGRIISGLDSSLKLIDNAAGACVRELSLFDAVCVFCGKGNNGADGYRIARLLHDIGKEVRVVSVFGPGTRECRLLADDCRAAGIEITPFEELKERPRCEAVVDAIFGIGISGQVTGTAAAAIEYINSMGAFVLSADVPSGLDADRGTPCGVSVRADKTVTFTAPKTGMISNESVDICGELLVREAGIPVAWDEVPLSQPKVITAQTAAALLPRRPRLSHKGTFGRLLMIAGSPGMMGAAIMAARAALRSGCGLVTVVCRRGMENLINLAVPQAVALPVEGLEDESLERAVDSASAILVGCGSGKSLTPGFIQKIIAAGKPTVLDADGLNTLAGRAELLRGGNVVITPHPLEFSRLTGKPVGEIEADRIKAAEELAAELGITVLLKGARTVIAGEETHVSLCATSALARGGSGDVLAGVIGSLLAQGITPEKAAVLGTYLHGRSGMISGEKCTEYSVTTDDIIDNLKYSFMEVESIEQSWKSLGRN